jgi:hypothetical protein
MPTNIYELRKVSPKGDITAKTGSGTEKSALGTLTCGQGVGVAVEIRVSKSRHSKNSV